MSPSTRASVSVVSAMVMWLGCEGVIDARRATESGAVGQAGGGDDPVVGFGGGSTGSGGSGGSGGGTPMVDLCPPTTPIAPTRTPLRRLTNAEYNATVEALLADTSRPGDSFTPDAIELGFDNNADLSMVSQLWFEQTTKAAEVLAAAASGRASLLPCTPSSSNPEACAQQFISAFGRRAYRRPLTSAEASSFLGLFRLGLTAGGFSTGVQYVVQAALMSPHFLYRPEFGSGPATASGGKTLTPFEVASRLSYLLWGSMPDDTLLDAAAQGGLDTPAQVGAQARRLLQHPRARTAVTRFYAQWLGLSELDSLQKDAQHFPSFTAATGASMRKETEKFVESIFFDGPATTQALLTTTTTFVDPTLAPLYGLSAGSGWQRVQLNAAQRSGLLTQLSTLANNAHPDQSSPVLRGKFVRERLLCQALPPPPAGLVIVLPPLDPNLTTRERYAAHSANPACAGCHKMMDPIGLGFEHFDSIGRWRDAEGNKPIDDTTVLTGSDVDGTFHGVPALAAQLAQSQQVQTCMATHWFRYTYGRAETAADRCAVQELATRLRAAGGDVRELLVSMVQTNPFLQRAAP